MMHMGLIDMHSHVTPLAFPKAPSAEVAARWPCMRSHGATDHTLMIGDKPFRALDDRSWSIERRREDMEREGVAMQLLSPMPELLSYWITAADADVMCDHVNQQIADMVARQPCAFRGLGAVPLQDPVLAARRAQELRSRFDLLGVEIGSNINGILLGDRRFDPFYEALQEANLPLFVHALHPVAAKSIEASASYTAFALFPVDVGMAIASMIIAGTFDRFPRLRVGFSHGGGTLASLLGRLDTGWRVSEGFGVEGARLPSDIARTLFFDSNVYNAHQLHSLATVIAPGQVFLGTDYPYSIMQNAPADYLESAGLDLQTLRSVCHGAAEEFLGQKILKA